MGIYLVISAASAASAAPFAKLEREAVRIQQCEDGIRAGERRSHIKRGEKDENTIQKRHDH